MCFGARNVLTRQTLVEIDGGVDLLHDCRRAAGKPASPHFIRGHDPDPATGLQHWNPGMNYRTRAVALAAGCVVVIALVVLYGIDNWNVHAGPRPPAVLNRLQLVSGQPAAPKI